MSLTSCICFGCAVFFLVLLVGVETARPKCEKGDKCGESRRSMNTGDSNTASSGGEIAPVSEKKSTSTSAVNRVHGAKQCYKCLSRCRCKNGSPDHYHQEDKWCHKCCSKKRCRHLDYEEQMKLWKTREQEKRHPPHVYLQVIGDNELFRAKHHPKLASGVDLPFQDGSRLMVNGEMIVAGRRVKHGWVASDHSTAKHSPKLFYDNVRIKKTGIYMLYAQVVFRYKTSQHSSFVIRKYLPSKIKDTEGQIVSQCEGTSTMQEGQPIYQSSCFTQTVTYLERGTKIRVECHFLEEKKCPPIVMHGKRTFFGVVLVD